MRYCHMRSKKYFCPYNKASSVNKEKDRNANMWKDTEETNGLEEGNN